MLHLNAKRKLAATAKSMFEGSLHYLAGAIEIEKLRHDVNAYENDPDFLPFVAILLEIDRLEIGRDPKQWDKSLGHKKQKEIQESIDWAKDISLNQCQSLVKRYSLE